MRFTIIYVPAGQAAIDLWVTLPGQPLLVTCAPAESEAAGWSSKLSITLQDPSGDGPFELNLGRLYECTGQPGMWKLNLAPKQLADPGQPVRIEITVEGAYPFTVPGPGVIPSHFRQGRPWLRFPASPQLGPQFYLPVPAALDSVYLGGWLKGHETLDIEYADGSTERIPWHLVEHAQHGVVVPVNGRSGWWRITLLPTEQDYYVTTGWTGLPLFFQRPPSFFPFAEIEASVIDEQHHPVDARLSLYRDDDWQAIRVAMDAEPALLYAVPGQLVIVASRGLEYGPSARGITAEPGSRHTLELTVSRTISHPDGWLCGDHHVHSYYEDGALAPAQIAQAARGEGLDYMFLTDTPDPLLPAGLQQYNVPSKFLALPGQELGNPQCHFNALNTRHHIDHPPFGTFPDTFPGPGEWIPQVEAQATPEHPTAYMLNHPAHFAELTARVAYFRSWWLVDAHPQITVIENSPFEPWYERLNAGRQITHLWTTDSHDAGLLPPGSRRAYIFTDGEFSEHAIIQGIRSGRSFNAREPGAWLDFSVNGATMGQVAANATGTLTARVSCQASIPLSRIELICNGKCLHTWWVDEARSFTGEISLRGRDARWLIAIVYADHALKYPDQHVNPLDMDGLLAFTNPVYVDAH
jgi:hypothetical protein